MILSDEIESIAPQLKHDALESDSEHLYAQTRNVQESLNLQNGPVLLPKLRTGNAFAVDEGIVGKNIVCKGSWQRTLETEVKCVRVKQVHKPDGFVASMACLQKDLIPNDVNLLGWCGQHVTWTRSINPVATLGWPLSSSKSVLEAAECLFDTIAVLWSLEQRGFSYQAISLSNILIRPTHFLGPSEFLPPKENRPIRYVSELLGENKFCVKVVLYDFNNVVRSSSRALDTPAGRPLFAARDVLSARGYPPTIDDCSKQEIANLSSMLNDVDDDSLTSHLNTFFSKKSDAIHCETHLPIHDAESVFKVFSFYLLRVRVQGIRDEDNLEERSRRIVMMLNQKFNRRFVSKIWAENRQEPIDASEGFAEQLAVLDNFFFLAWYGFSEFQRGGVLEFSGHILLQRFFGHFILKCTREGRDPLQIDPHMRQPLRVWDKNLQVLSTGMENAGRLGQAQPSGYHSTLLYEKALKRLWYLVD